MTPLAEEHLALASALLKGPPSESILRRMKEFCIRAEVVVEESIFLADTLKAQLRRIDSRASEACKLRDFIEKELKKYDSTASVLEQ